MKIKYIFTLTIGVVIIIFSSVIILSKEYDSYDIFKSVLYSIIGLVAVITIMLKEKSIFVSFFAFTSLLFYSFDIMYPICKSIILERNLVFEKLSFLSKTEGFILFVSMGYLVLTLLKNRNKA